jgi:hypothetical protein
MQTTKTGVGAFLLPIIAPRTHQGRIKKRDKATITATSTSGGGGGQ